MEDEQHAVNVDLDGRERENLAEFYRLDRHDGDRDGARGWVFCIIGRRSGHRPILERRATRQFHLMVEKPAIATPADQPPARVVRRLEPRPPLRDNPVYHVDKLWYEGGTRGGRP